MFTIHEVAKHLRVTAGTVTSWIKTGQLGAIDLAPPKSKRRFFRVSQEQIAAFEKARLVGPPVRIKPIEKPVKEWV